MFCLQTNLTQKWTKCDSILHCIWMVLAVPSVTFLHSHSQLKYDNILIQFWGINIFIILIFISEISKIHLSGLFGGKLMTVSV